MGCGREKEPPSQHRGGADRNKKRKRARRRRRRERDPGDLKRAGGETGTKKKGGAFRPRIEEAGPAGRDGDRE